MTYVAAANRYQSMRYRRSGRSGVLLPELSLGFWQNFGDNRPMDTQRAIVRYAFDRGVTHFDLANNYGPPYGSAETNFGHILAPGFGAVPGRAVHLHQSGLGHVARPVRRPRVTQVPAREPRSVAAAHGPGLCRRLLLAPRGSGHAARGDDGRAGFRRAPGEGALCRRLLVFRTADRRGRAHPARVGNAAAHSSAVVFPAESLDRGIAPRHVGAGQASAASPSRRWRRACSPTSTSRASPPIPGWPGRTPRCPVTS